MPDQFARPVADAAAGLWTTTPLWSKVDEAAADDGDAISSEVLTTPGNTSNADLTLGALVDPISSTGHTLRVRAKATFTLGLNGGVRGELRQGAALIATLTSDALTTGYVTYSYALSGAECDAITDYGVLFLRLYGVLPIGNLGGIQVSWVELQAPPPPAQTVALTPATATWGASSIPPAPGATVLALVAATAAWAATILAVTGGGVSVALTPATSAWTGSVLVSTAGGVQVALAAATAAWTAGAVAGTPGPIQIVLAPAGAAWAAQGLTNTRGPVTVGLTVASAAWSAMVLAILPPAGRATLSVRGPGVTVRDIRARAAVHAGPGG